MQALVNQFVALIWGTPMLILLVGGGIGFTIYARLLPFRYFRHSLSILTGKFDADNNNSAAGDLSHKQALSAALAGTLGLGNVAGVALAITAGGPGAIFWMWVTALIGISTKFFTCSLGVMFRGKDSTGQIQGGPMYVIETGLGKKWKALAVLFAAAGLFGTMPSFQINQLGEVVRTQLLPADLSFDFVWFNALFGLTVAILVGMVIWGGLQRVANTAARLVPAMTILYLLMTLAVLVQHIGDIPSYFIMIVADAWAPESAAGGLLGVIIIGVSRGAFSNEAGVGTEVMAHGAAKTNEPIREGLVASLGPVVDTLLVCTCTALVIIASGVWKQAEGMQGVQLTLNAFTQEIGILGQILLSIMVLLLSMTTVFTYWYYGQKCFSYLFGADKASYFKYLYLMMVVLGAVLTMEVVFNFMVGVYGLMAIPTMISAILLAPKVMAEAKLYFAKLD